MVTSIPKTFSISISKLIDNYNENHRDTTRNIYKQLKDNPTITKEKRINIITETNTNPSLITKTILLWYDDLSENYHTQWEQTFQTNPKFEKENVSRQKMVKNGPNGYRKITYKRSLKRPKTIKTKLLQDCTNLPEPVPSSSQPPRNHGKESQPRDFPS